MRTDHPRLHRWRKMHLGMFIAAILGAFIATHTPPADLPTLPASDKTLHFVGFLVLGSLLLLTLASYRVSRLHRVGLVIGLLATYAMIDETTQPFFRRTCDINDWLADMTGAVAAVVIVEAVLLAVELRRHRRIRQAAQNLAR
jgi:VanZ family protein